MATASNLRQYYPAVIEERMFGRERNLAVYQRWLFDGVAVPGRTVLDVGAGSGLFGFYAACSGAAEVVCLEPEVEGSTSGAREKFFRVRRRLGMENIHLERVRLQDYEPGARRFDVVLLHNAVNHLDERACVALLTSQQARERYSRIFTSIASWSRPGTKLIAADCSRYNFFGDLGLRNPFMPTIEWEKHQTPEVWAAMLEEVGFARPRIRWSSFNRLGRAGQLLLGHGWPAYFLKSHFCLTMELT